MKKMMVDMDEVITTGGFLKAIEEFLDKKIDLDKVDTYYLQTLLGDKADDFWKSSIDRNFYDGNELIEASVDILEKLSKHFDIYIVTSYLWDGVVDLSANHLKHKYEYLKEHLPFISPRKYIFTTDKLIMDFDIRIDDKLANLSGAETKIMFKQWHNKKHTKKELAGVYVVDSWQQIYEILKDIYKFED